MKKKHVLYTTLALVAVLILLERIYSAQHRGFRLAKLVSPQPSTASDPPPTEIDVLLNQSFHYVNGGGTCFAFLGEDGKTILKLFKHHQLFYKHFLFNLTFPAIADYWRIEKIFSHEKKNQYKRHSFFFNSCALAYSELKEETGLIYLCLHPNLHFNRNIKLIDAWGIPHDFNLSRTEFALQKKAQLFFPYLENLIQQNCLEDAKCAIDLLISQMICRCKKGIGNCDLNLRNNFGYVDGQVIEFDLGSYYSDSFLRSTSQRAGELFFTTTNLQNWLEKHSTELLNYLLTQITKLTTNDAESS